MPAKKGKKRAKPEGEDRLCGDGNSKKHRQCMQMAIARGTREVIALRTKLVAEKAEHETWGEAKRAALDARENELCKREAQIDAKAARDERREEKRVEAAKAKKDSRLTRCLASFTGTPRALCAQQNPLEALEAEVEKLKHTRGMVTTESQSRCILLLWLNCMMNGASSSEATAEVAKTLRVGEKKVKAVRRTWIKDGKLLSVSAKGRGSVKGQGDRRLALNASSADGSVDEEGIGSGLVDESPEPGCEVTVGGGVRR